MELNLKRKLKKIDKVMNTPIYDIIKDHKCEIASAVMTVGGFALAVFGLTKFGDTMVGYAYEWGYSDGLSASQETLSDR